MYYGSGTVHAISSGKLADVAAYAAGGRCVCTYQMAALFYVKWHNGRHHLESMSLDRKSDSANRIWRTEF